MWTQVLSAAPHSGTACSVCVFLLSLCCDSAHQDILARDHMILDGWPVIAEDYMQWVIEDSFCCGRPEWDKVRCSL
jgi:hypothetical protein